MRVKCPENKYLTMNEPGPLGVQAGGNLAILIHRLPRTRRKNPMKTEEVKGLLGAAGLERVPAERGIGVLGRQGTNRAFYFRKTVA